MRELVVMMLVVVSLVSGSAFAGKEPSYAEKMALRHVSEFLDEADQLLGKIPLDRYTTADGGKMVEEKITRAKQEMTRCPKGAPELAAAEERIVKIRAAIAAKVEEAKALAPGAKKVTVAVKALLQRLEDEKKSSPMTFQDANHKMVVRLRDDLSEQEKLLGAAGNPEHADAKEAAAAIADAKAKLQAALDDQKKAIESLGNWQAKAKALGDKLDGRYKMVAPIDDRKVDGWIDLLAEAKADVDAAEAHQKLVSDTVANVSEVAEFKALKDKLWNEKQVFEQETTYWYNDFLHDITYANNTSIAYEKLPLGVDGLDEPRGMINRGIAAAKHKEKYLRVYLKDDAAAAGAASEVKQLEAKLASLAATEEKLLTDVRMGKPRGTPEMQKLLKQVLGSKDFVAQMKNEGNTVLRAIVIEDKISHTKTTEWYQGRWYTRDFDTFSCLAAMKDSQYKKVWKWQFEVRFARSDLPKIKTGVWTYGGWVRGGPILESNVNK